VELGLSSDNGATSIARASRAPVRPLVHVAAALAIGAVVGRTGTPSPAWLALTGAACLGAWGMRCWLAPDKGATHARAPGGMLLVMVALVSAWRVRPPPPGTTQLAEPSAPSVASFGAVDSGEVDSGAVDSIAIDPIATDPAEPPAARDTAQEAVYAFPQQAPTPQREDIASLRGVWSPGTPNVHGEFGRLVDAHGVGWRLVLPLGIARAGETLEVLPVERPFRPARGAEPAPRTPGSLDSHALWRVRTDEVRRIAPAAPRLSNLEVLQRLRRWSIARCERFGADAAAFARALLFGDETRISVQVGDLFTRTGVRHILSVSGMHVALLAGFLALALGSPARTRGRSAGAVAIVLVVALYSVLSGAQAPIRRAALTVALAVAALALCRRGEATTWRRADPVSLLAAALCVEAATAPRNLFSISLQLSYAATAGLILGAGPLGRWVGVQRRAVALALAGQVRGRGPARLVEHAMDELVLGGARLRATGLARGVGAWAARAFDTACGASLAATLATAPLCWIALGEISPIGLLATPWVGPLIAWLLGYGLAAVYLPLPVAGFTLPYEALIATLEAFDGAPASPLPLPPRPTALLLCVTAGLAVWAQRRRPRLADSGRRVACAAAGIALLPWGAAPAGLEVRALDAGHGTAVLVRTPSNRVWVFDAGTKDRFALERAALGPQLAAWGPKSVGVIVSHADRDHRSALEWLGERWPVHTWIGASSTDSPARKQRNAQHWLAPADSVEFVDAGGELRLRVLSGAQLARASENECSLAVVIEGLGQRIVLTGDAVREGVDAWLATGALVGPTALLLWPHHGDPGERASELLAACTPERVWISGARPGGVERELQRAQVPWDATYRSGPLGLTLRPRREEGAPP
jgi:ComEC/Rec2-related protein